MTICQKCNCVKPPRTHHCRKCGRCVVRMDHHCRWVANCIGQRNLKQFLLFVFYLAANCVYTTIVFFTVGVECLLAKADDSVQCKQGHLLRPEYLSITTVSAGLSVLVGAFCLCLFANQLHLIKQNRSYIDNL